MAELLLRWTLTAPELQCPITGKPLVTSAIAPGNELVRVRQAGLCVCAPAPDGSHSNRSGLNPAGLRTAFWLGDEVAGWCRECGAAVPTCVGRVKACFLEPGREGGADLLLSEQAVGSIRGEALRQPVSRPPHCPGSDTHRTVHWPPPASGSDGNGG